MKKTKLLTLVMAMVMMAMSPMKMWAISGSGTSDDPYLIGSTSDWTNSSFMSALEKSSDNNRVYIRITAPFTVTSVMLRDKEPYINLDGQGHTITLSNVSTTEENTGLFGKIGGGAVYNLRIAGNMGSSKKYIGNLCGRVTGSWLSVRNVICSASISGDMDGDATAGGIVGQIDDGTVSFSQCGFTYRLYGHNKADKMCGMVGYRGKNAKVEFTNCFCKAEWINPKSGENYAYMRNDGSNTTYNNCYYVTYGTGGKATNISSGGPTQIDASKFSTGELAYLLNGSENGKKRWYQNIDRGSADGYPWPYANSLEINNNTISNTTHNLVYYGYIHGSSSKSISNYSNKVSDKQHLYYTSCTPKWSNTGTPASCKATLSYTCSSCSSTASEANITPTHSTTKVATCAATGTESYTATSTTYKKDASNYYSVSTTGTLAALGHDYSVTSDAATYQKSAATCTADALYYYKCSRCNEKGTTTWANTGTATGHGQTKGYTPTYTWSDDINKHTCNFTLMCKDCSTNVVSNSTLTGTQTAHTDAKCTTAGSTTYQVTGSYNATGSKAYSENNPKEYTIAATGHGQTNGYAPTYTWSTDINTHTCSFTLKCKDCNTNVVSNSTLTGSQTAHTDPTCTATGSTTYKVTGSYDATGSKAYSGNDTNIYTINATGHSWSETSVWAWGEDGKSASCTRTCINDATHKSAQSLTLGKGITSAVKVAATCLDKGTTTYSATATVEGKEYTDTKDVVDIPAAGHTWSETSAWVWADDGHSASCTRTCQRDASHTSAQSVTLGNGITSSTEIAATCIRKGTTTYSATATVEGKEYTDIKYVVDIDATGHSWSETATWIWAEDGYSALCTRTCQNDATHTSAQTAILDKGITSAVSVEPTCLDKGTTKYSATATVEGKEYTDTKDVVDIPAKGHSWSEKAAWSWGDDGHSATCTLTCERDASHTSVQPKLTFGNGITSTTKVEPKCLEKGTTTYSAKTTVEGKQYTDTKDIVDIPAIGHSWSETADWEWNDDGKNASCTITCENDRSHQQTFDNSTATKVSITHSETKAATCAEMGENTYKASVTYEGTTYNATDKVIADIARPKHTFDKVSDPDETNCTVCSHTIIHYTADEEINIIMPDYDYHTFEAKAKKGEIEYNTLLTSIPKQYFLSCTGLKGISIPNSVTSIGDQAFYSCTGLKSISIPNSVTSIGDQAFYNCTDLESVSIPNSVTSIGEFAFTNCGKIKELSLGNSIESIGKAAFAVCTGLTNLSIPNSVRNIGEGAFVMCSNLTNVELMSIPKVGSEAFANVPAPIKLSLTDNSYVYTSSNTYFPTLSSAPTYSRTMNAEWGTLVLPFDVPASVENQYTLYKVVTHDTENGCISLCQASGTVAAGTPVIVQRLTTDTQLTFTASNENIDATGNLETNELVGTFVKTDLTNENGFIIYGDEFWSIATLANAGKTVKTAPFRAYITDDSATADAKLFINIDNSATGIYNAASGTYASADGDNVKIYNLQGQRINTPVKGINIINGKKVFIKNLQLGEAK